jgi:type IV secretion system protein VirD4
MTIARRILFGTTALCGSVLTIMSAASEWIAFRLQFHPALGEPWFGHFYAPWSWLLWNQAPWAPQCRWTLVIADVGVVIASMAAMVPFAVWRNLQRRRPKRNEGVYGTARFQDEAEIRASGLVASYEERPGVYVGAWQDRKGNVKYLRDDGDTHVAVIAPTRSGKGIGVIVPTLLSYPESALIYDEKGELWEMTAGWREQGAGNLVLRWEPGALKGSVAFNFLDEVRLETPYEIADAQNIALVLTDPKGEGIDNHDHWDKTAFETITALILHALYLARAKNRAASLSDVARMLSDPEHETGTLWEEMRTNEHLRGGTPEERRHWFIAAAGRDMLDRPIRERGSVISSTKSFLMLFKDTIVERNTQRSDFCLHDLMDGEKPASVYIVTRGPDKERLRPLVRLFLTMAMRYLTGAELQFQDGRPVMPHKHRLLFMLDEMPSLGRMELIESMLARCAGYGIKAVIICQDRGQLVKAYGEHQTITGNCHIRVVYAPNETATAEWISRLSGKKTEVQEDITESGRRFGWLRTVTRTYRQHSRDLLTPDEVMNLQKPRRDAKEGIVSPGEILVFIAGERPIKGLQILYYLDPVFLARAQIKPPTPSPYPTPFRFRFAHDLEAQDAE